MKMPYYISETFTEIHRDNYHEKSFAQFHLVKNKSLTDWVLSFEPNFISYKKPEKTEVSSQCWYTHKGVYRLSNHWGCVSDCLWYLNEKGGNRLFEKPVLAFCRWETMKEIKELDKWAFNNPVFNAMTQKAIRGITIRLSRGDFYLAKNYNGVFVVDSVGRHICTRFWGKSKIFSEILLVTNATTN